MDLSHKRLRHQVLCSREVCGIAGSATPTPKVKLGINQFVLQVLQRTFKSKLRVSENIIPSTIDALPQFCNIPPSPGTDAPECKKNKDLYTTAPSAVRNIYS